MSAPRNEVAARGVARSGVARAIALAGVVASLTTGCEGRPRRTGAVPKPTPATIQSEPHLAILDLRSGAPELPEQGLFGSPAPRSYAHLVGALRAIDDEENVKGVFVRLGTTSMGLARATETGRLLAGLRKKGLAVDCHAEGYDNATAMMAAMGCDRVWLTPAGGVDTVGIAGQLLFARGLLDRMKVDVDFLQVGKFKGAQETFTRSSPSAEARRSLETALGGLRGAWLGALAKGRGKTAVELGAEDGPHGALEAKKRGLVDELAFASEALEAAEKRADVDNRVSYFGRRKRGGGGGVAELVRVLSSGTGSTLDNVAIVRASGAITLKPGGGAFGGGGIAEQRLSKTLRKLKDDEGTKAVVLRLDSPGGSALASDLLWKSLMDLRKEKPLIVSIGGMAASGGYYMACTGTKILAEKTSIVGSIGVVAGKLSFERTISEIGLSVTSVPAAGPDHTRSLYASGLSRWDEATKARVLESMQGTYELFVQRIATGRGVPAKAVHPAAEGRIMGGEAALKLGLIDELGGLSDAIDLAKKLGELPDDAPVRVVTASPELLGLFGIDDPDEAEAPVESRGRRLEQAAVRALARDLLPYRTELTTLLGSYSPLLAGETTLAALPFGLAVR